MRICFISALKSSPWGGSELLWSQAARHLALSGVEVLASIRKWPTRAKGLNELADLGVEIYERGAYASPSFFRRLEMRMKGERISCGDTDNYRLWLKKVHPDFVCVSCSVTLDGLAAAEACLLEGIPYAIICQANSEAWWPNDSVSARALEVYGGAQKCYFVSNANKYLAEMQLGTYLTQAEVIFNPFGLKYDSADYSKFPDLSDGLRLACVGRIDPTAKGQDLIIEVMTNSVWRDRKLIVNFFGSGDMEQGLKRNVARFGLENRINFCGYVNDVTEIWRNHHALILPSRHEGLPIALVEAMLCGRPAVVTAVAGNPEVVEDGVNGFIAEATTAKSLGLAMEKLWEQRNRIAQMGHAAALEIRKKVPMDPAAVFADKIKMLAQEANFKQ